MRFETLSLERYGAFCDRELRFADRARLHVLHGPNEAGKTSALAAIGDFLFGFGHSTPYAFEHEQAALRVGATLKLDDGSSLKARRRKGRSMTLLDDVGRPLDADPLPALLGGISRRMFETEFGLTAQALRAGGNDLLDAGGRLAETLAAGSAGLSAVVALRGDLRQEADQLFRPTRSASREFYAASDRHEAADRRLREATVTVDAWNAANREADEAAAAHAMLKQEEARLRADLARRERTRRTRPKLAEIEALRRQLAQFDDLADVDADMLARRRQAVADDSRLREQLGDLDETDARDLARLAALHVDAALLDAGATIDAVRERIGAIAKAREDLPRRRGAQRLARDNLAESGRRLGLASPEALLAAQPTEAALARARSALTQAQRAAERLQEAEQASADAMSERERLATERPAGGFTADPTILKRRLDALACIPPDTDRLRRDQAAITAASRKLLEEGKCLAPPVGSLDNLAARPLPLPADIARATTQHARVEDEIRAAAAAFAGATEQLLDADREIARLAGTGAAATRADLRVAREERDAAFAAMAAGLGAPNADRQRQLDILGAASRKVDELTDWLLADAKRAALSEAASARRTDAQERLANAQQSRAAAIATQQRVQHDWEATWQDAGIAPLAPAAMERWRERVAKLMEARSALGESHVAVAALQSKLEGMRAPLGELAGDCGVPTPSGVPIEVLYGEVSSAVAALQAAWMDARERAIASEKAAQDLKRAEVALAKRRTEADACHAGWPTAVGALGLPADAGFAEAEAALAIWREVPVERRNFERESQSVDGIERDLEAFEQQVAALAQASAPDLASRPAGDALARLTERLGEARRAAEQRAHLRNAVDERRPQREAIAAKIGRIVAMLDAARQQLGIDLAAPLAPALERLATKHGLRADHARCLADLAATADGHDEETLRQEQADIDFISLDRSLDEHKVRLDALRLHEIGDAHAREMRAREKVQDLARGRDAEVAAQAKQEAAAEILDVAERWIVRAAAAKLAGLAIERHRASVQDPLVARASELFATVTGGAFCGLATQYDDDNVAILVGRRANGRTVEVEGMSEGTRDQLYLVLRLALLERHTLGLLPFIGDDLLASFDEARTSQALDLLAAFGAGRQVILFTHHAHVAEIALRRLGAAADLIRL